MQHVPSLIPHLAEIWGQMWHPGERHAGTSPPGSGYPPKEKLGQNPVLSPRLLPGHARVMNQPLAGRRRGKSPNSSGCSILSSANEAWMGLRCFAGHYPKLT